MTVLCGGGTSGPKPGLGTTLILPVGLITAGLGLISPWLLPFAALLDGEVFDLVAQCATDPPPIPTFTLSDAEALVGGVLNPNFNAALSKLSDLVRNYFWFQYCQCNTVTTPAFGPPPPAPTGVTTISGTPQTACFTATYGQQPQAFDATGPPTAFPDTTPGLLPVNGAPHVITRGDGRQITVYPIPPGVTQVQFSWIIPPPYGTCPGSPANAYIEFWNSSNVELAHTSSVIAATPGPLTGSLTMNIPSGTAYWDFLVWLQACGGNPLPTGIINLNVQVLCGGGYGSLSSPCAPDPALYNLVSNIWQEVQAIYNSLPQRIHTFEVLHDRQPLSGSGLFVLDPATVAVEVAVILPVPNTVGVELLNPIQLFGDNFITFSAQGFANFKSFRLTTTPQYFYVPPGCDTVNYTLVPQVQVDIAELGRAT